MSGVEDIPDEELLRRAVSSARKYRRKHPRWVAVMHVFQLGSNYSAQLCRRFNMDPEEEI